MFILIDKTFDKVDCFSNDKDFLIQVAIDAYKFDEEQNIKREYVLFNSETNEIESIKEY